MISRLLILSGLLFILGSVLLSNLRWEGPNAGDVIQSAIEALPPEGGTVNVHEILARSTFRLKLFGIWTVYSVAPSPVLYAPNLEVVK